MGSKDCVLTLIPSPYNSDKNLNNESVVAVLKNGDNTFLFTGDAEKEEESAEIEAEEEAEAEAEEETEAKAEAEAEAEAEANETSEPAEKQGENNE